MMDGVALGIEGKGLAASPGALAGVRVVDLTRVLGGSYATMILSDHGAAVLAGLGCSENEMAALRADGVLFDTRR